MVYACFEANACKKYGSENHIGADFHFLIYVRRILDGAKHYACHICDCNVCNSNIMFRLVCKEKAEGKA